MKHQGVPFFLDSYIKQKGLVILNLKYQNIKNIKGKSFKSYKKLLFKYKSLFIPYTQAFDQSNADEYRGNVCGIYVSSLRKQKRISFLEFFKIFEIVDDLAFSGSRWSKCIQRERHESTSRIQHIIGNVREDNEIECRVNVDNFTQIFYLEGQSGTTWPNFWL